MDKRSFTRTLGHAVLTALLAAPLAASAAAPVIKVYKSATCGCCKGWVEHLKAAGFTVEANDVPDPSVYRQKAGIGDQFGSCHTALVGKYAIEGHVPAAEIRRLLKEKPAARGLSVPGMPMGSPGMEGEHKAAYDVVLVKQDGSSTVYRHHQGD
ncbi:MAG: DUF411 domain-containing protein [Gammaproteobacteria bacterium]